MVDDGAIAQLLDGSVRALDHVADELLRLALDAGGVDNITLVLARPVS